jgi:hypothetical protein
MAMPRMYSAPDIDLSHMANAMAEWLQPRGYETQVLNIPAGLCVQGRQTRSWAQRNSVALTVQLVRQGENLSVEIGTSKWMVQAVTGVAAALILWPVLALVGYTAYKQKEIIDDAWTWVNQYISSGGQVSISGWATVAPPQPWATPSVSAACSACGAPVRPEAKFCDNCGAKLTLECSGCGATLRPDAKFCDGCGERAQQT